MLVYPALANRTGGEWPVAHARHARAVTPLVGMVYGALVVTGAALLLSGPGPAAWVALAAEATAMALTATLAAPTHRRLARRDERALARLLRADRWRCAAAVIGLVAAVVSVAFAGLE